jgi:hypothetical protein
MTLKANPRSWHADLKPDNVLPFGGAFKLADLGFARFERSDKVVTNIKGGTRTYGMLIIILEIEKESELINAKVPRSATPKDQIACTLLKQ